MATILGSYRKARRIVRALQGKDTWQTIQIGGRKICLGNAGASWCVCPDELSTQSRVYSFGVGEDVSFDLQLIEKFGCALHAFDPTPRSIEWLSRQTLPAGFQFHSFGVGAFDGKAMFTPPADSAHVSHTMFARRWSQARVEFPVYRLQSIMKLLKHRTLDVLKMDIEGAEYAVLDDMLSCEILPGQVLVEFHHRWPEIDVEMTRIAIKNLNQAGYKIFHVSDSGEEYSFRRV